MTRPKPTKHLARPSRRDRAGKPVTPHPESSTPPATNPAATPAPTTSAPETSASATSAPEDPPTATAHPESPSAHLVIADLALQALRATPPVLPEVLLARCDWAAALPPAALRQFADQTTRSLRRATPESLPQDLTGILAEWHQTARSFGAP